MKITHVKIREVLFILFLFFPPGKTFQQIYVSTIHGRVRMSQTGLGIVRQMSGRVYCEFPSVGSIPFFFLFSWVSWSMASLFPSVYSYSAPVNELLEYVFLCVYVSAFDL